MIKLISNPALCATMTAPLENSRNFGSTSSIVSASTTMLSLMLVSWLDLKWNRHLRIDKDGKTIHDRTLFHTHRTDLDDPVCHRTETGCLDIKYDIWIIQTLPLASGDHAFHIIYQICLPRRK